MTIALTERAGRKLREMIEANGLPDSTALRVGVRSGGCAGLTYMLDLCEGPIDSDAVFTSQGLRIVCDPKSLLHLDGLEIGYSDEDAAEGFLFRNPRANVRCSCGVSFRG